MIVFDDYCVDVFDVFDDIVFDVSDDGDVFFTK